MRLVMLTARRRAEGAIARTIRFPRRLRERIAADVERCGRSFEAHVIAILRRHFGEDVDIAPAPRAIVALAKASFADVGRPRVVAHATEYLERHGRLAISAVSLAPDGQRR